MQAQPWLGEAGERTVEIVDADRDVAVARPDVVGASVVVEGQHELGVVAGEGVEVVGRLELSVADDVEVAGEVHPNAS